MTDQNIAYRVNFLFIFQMYRKSDANKLVKNYIREPDGIPMSILLEHAETILDHRDWFYVSRHYTLNSEFLMKYRKKVDWQNVCRCQTFTEDWYRLFSLYIRNHWVDLIKRQKLPSSVLDSLEDVLWETVSRFGTLGYRSVIKHKHKIDWDVYLRRSDVYIGKKIIDNCKDVFPKHYGSILARRNENKELANNGKDTEYIQEIEERDLDSI